MGKTFNSHFGYFDLPSEILQVGIYEDFIEFDCVDGVYRCNIKDNSKSIRIKKVHCKLDSNDSNATHNSGSKV